jgi:hypothetical protein
LLGEFEYLLIGTPTARGAMSVWCCLFVFDRKQVVRVPPLRSCPDAILG